MGEVVKREGEPPAAGAVAGHTTAGGGGDRSGQAHLRGKPFEEQEAALRPVGAAAGGEARQGGRRMSEGGGDGTGAARERRVHRSRGPLPLTRVEDDACVEQPAQDSCDDPVAVRAGVIELVSGALGDAVSSYIRNVTKSEALGINRFVLATGGRCQMGLGE